MKKGIIVLLIAVLISGFAFAGTFKGSAALQFGVDFDEHTWGFANPKFGQYKFSFEFDTTAVSIGADHQTDVWAELAAEAKASIGLAPGAGVDNRADNATAFHAAYTAKITTANIHIGDIVIGILDSGTAVNYAKSYYKVGGAALDKVKGDSKLQPGFTVTYDGWYGGFGATGLWDDDSSTYHIWGHGKTKSFTFADGLTGEAGGYAVMDSSDKYIGGGLKVDYAADKITAGIAGDGVLKKADIDFGIEGAIYATYDFLRLDIYGASKEYFDNYGEDDAFLKLDAKLSANYTFDLSDDIALAVTGWVDARDTLIKALSLEIGSTQATTVDAFTIELKEVATLANLADADKDVAVGLEASEKVTYKAEKFTAYESVSAKFDFSADESLKALVLEAGISSTAIVENATLALVYKTKAAKIAFKDDANGSKGAITASCTINF